MKSSVPSFRQLAMEYKIRWESSCSLLLGNRIFGELPILWIGGIKGKGEENW